MIIIVFYEKITKSHFNFVFYSVNPWRWRKSEDHARVLGWGVSKGYGKVVCLHLCRKCGDPRTHLGLPLVVAGW
jgi:hypothetical protein